jgi:hypothetical protein
VWLGEVRSGTARQGEDYLCLIDGHRARLGQAGYGAVWFGPAGCGLVRSGGVR